MIEGIVVDLLKVKWKTFIKKNFFGQIIRFAFYFLISLYCFVTRPVGKGTECLMSNGTNWTSLDIINNSSLASPLALDYLDSMNESSDVSKEMNSTCEVIR